MYDQLPADIPRTSHHLVPRTSYIRAPLTFRGRRHLKLLNIFFPVKDSSRCVKQGLFHLKNTFFIKSSIFALAPWESPEGPLKVPWKFRKLGPLGNLQRTSPGRGVLAGYVRWSKAQLFKSIFWLILFCKGNSSKKIYWCSDKDKTWRNFRWKEARPIWTGKKHFWKYM